ncbi:K(+)-transporting ATPase subunit C [Sphaerospermopsis aphanizomenoides BCCUSP55]|uniref:K(+)-transporting ATPase subunit C n=1 Tax=Sphaerospermopsis aphanizomenoides TaxID=459663 RepID=UPI001907B939|nr:K(+)-transporting ATPase subunit C [Sphaerospermopsis aphanizomenoides]MBK1988588.1 K(+)-transporting ATPase subunit C [Sphaerospermopsis aphanizomenoides BCCUSP55]
MSLTTDAKRAIRATLITWLIGGLIYPFMMIIFGQLLLPYQANGSLITNSQGQVIGSSLIGQPFTSERYFNSRPSTTNYSTADPKKDEAGVLKTGVSGASNLAPSNVALIERIKGKDGFQRLQTADLVYTSGSSLDPHITPEAAKAQINRVAKARGVQEQQLETLINQNTDKRFLGIFGEPGVNVLKLNLALDALKSGS